MTDQANLTLESFQLDSRLRFYHDDSGLIRGEVRSPLCHASFYLHGAHICEFCPTDQRPVLFVSRDAVFRPGTAIRGGVPICFPWFGNHPTNPDAPAHGLVRTREWELVRTYEQDDLVCVVLGVEVNQLRAEYRMSFGTELSASLHVQNVSAERQCFEAALHTYLAVDDIHSVRVLGLESAEYYDKVSQQTCPPSRSALQVEAETDHIYQDTPDTVTVEDRAAGRRLEVAKTGSRSTVIWNPWIEKARAMRDFGDDQWQQMICVETACIGDFGIELPPGGEHTITAVIRAN